MFLFHPLNAYTDEGTPQGGIISPVLANLTRDGLEELLQAHFGKRSLEGLAYKVHFCRYADDWIITGNSKDCWNMKSTAGHPVLEGTRLGTLTGENTCNAHPGWV
jgi:hypothetical protein